MATMVLANEGKLAKLLQIRESVAYATPYTNNYTPVVTSVFSDFAPPPVRPYTALSWTTEAIVGGQGVLVSQSFKFGPGSTSGTWAEPFPKTIYGYFVQLLGFGQGYEIFGAVRFGSPVEIANSTDEITRTLTLVIP